MSLRDWLYIAVIGVCVIFLILLSIRTRKKKIANGEVADTGFRGYLDEIFDTVVSFMTGVEHSGVSGEMKKTMVKSKLLLWCQDKGIKYNDSMIDELIEALISFSKKVNAPTSQKESSAQSSSGSSDSVAAVAEAKNFFSKKEN